MPILLKEDYEYPLPKLTKVQQIFDDSKIEDVVSETKRELEKKEISEKIHKGDRVAIAIGSRGIRAYFTVDNVFCFTEYDGYDPEASYTDNPAAANYGVDFGLSPTMRSYIFGLQFKF